MNENSASHTTKKALALWKDGKHQEAIDCLVTYQTRERSIEVVRMLIWMYAYQRDLTSSLKSARYAFQLGKTPSDQAMLALVYVDIGKLNKAYREAQSAYKGDPNSSLASFALGSVYKRWGDYEKARYFLERAISLESGNYFYAYHLSLVYKELGNLVESKSVLEDLAIQETPQEIKSNVSWTLFTLADTPGEKIAHLQQLLKFDSNDIDSRKILIRLLIDIKQIDTADTELNHLSKSSKFTIDGDYYLLQGDIFALKNEWKHALRSYRMAQHFLPNSRSVLERIGTVLTLLGRDQAAIASFKQSFTQDSDDGFEETKLLITNHERVTINREIALEMIGMNPGTVILHLIKTAKESPKSFGKIIKSLWPYLLISLGLALAINITLTTSAGESWNTIQFLITLIFFWMMSFLVIAASWTLPRIFQLHPRAMKWLIYLLILYSPYLLVFLLGIVLPILAGSLGLALLDLLFFSIYAIIFLTAVDGLNRSRIEFTGKRILITTVVSLIASVLLTIAFQYFTFYAVSSILHIPPPDTPPSLNYFVSLESLVILYICFSITYAITLFIDLNITKLYQKFHSWRKTNRSISKHYQATRKDFVQEWGLSGRIIDSLISAIVYVPTLILLTVTKHVVFVWVLLCVCMISTALSIRLYIQYTLSPITFKRLNIRKLRDFIKNRQILQYENFEDKSIIILLALSLTLFLFTLFWINNSMLLFSFNYLYGDAGFPPSQLSISVHIKENIFDWFYQTFRLMVNGEFDIKTDNPMVKMFSIPISLSNFFLLTLFFSQILANLSDLSSSSRDQ